MKNKIRATLRWELFILSALALLLLSACGTLTMEVEPSDGQTAGRTQMEASDPETVSLSSGRPQLVKFFAFW
jgi:hypothetical protein